MDSTNVKVLRETNSAMSMEFVIAEASSPKPVLETSTHETRSPTIRDIQKKLDSAAERRKSLTLDRQSALAAHIAKIEDVHNRKSELDAQFIQSVKEATEMKHGAIESNRIAYLNDLKEKVKERLDKIQTAQQTKENSELEEAKQLMAAIEEKMNTVEANRDKNVQAMKTRLQAHEDAVNRINAAQHEQLLALKEKINTQLDKAEKNREAELKKIIEAAKEEEKKVEAARLKKKQEEGEN